MRGVWAPFARLPARHVAWAIAKLVAVTWMISYVITAPPETFATLGFFLVLFMPVSALAGVVSIVGMVMSHSPGAAATRRGLTIELAGLYVFAVAPIVHAATMIAIMIGDGTTSRFGPMMESLAILAFISVRVVEVRRPWSNITGSSRGGDAGGVS